MYPDALTMYIDRRQPREASRTVITSIPISRDYEDMKAITHDAFTQSSCEPHFQQNDKIFPRNFSLTIHAMAGVIPVELEILPIQVFNPAFYGNLPV
jgi:hypothetical protein